VATERLASAVLRGKQLFYDARDPRLARDAYMSCASCHQDGGSDGRTWDLTGLGEGLRNTPSLRGRAGMGHGLVHWSGNFDEIQDFEGQIRTLAGGTGLMTDAQFGTGTRSQPLGDRKAGVSTDLDALAAYVGSLGSFDLSPHRNADGTLTAAAAAGRAVFETAGCASCHAGTAYTAGGLRDIGTVKASSGRRLNATLTGIDVPTLRDVWATGPYLHDGSAATLEAAVQAHRGNTVAGTDLANLAAFLRQIGSEEAAAPTTNQPPTVSITAPASGSSVAAGTTITIAANAADGDGSIARVEFYDGGTLLGTDSTSPYAFSWSGAAVGAHTLTARAVDNLGAVTTSAGVTLTVNATTTPPTTPTTPPSTAILCANERSTCVLPAGATATVWYGAGSSWVVRTGVTGSIACTNAVFGDPIFGTIKSCRYVVTTGPTAPPATGTGLRGSYFASNNLSGTVRLVRTEAVDFNFGTGVPASGLPADNFSMRWEGFVEAPTAGSYQFQTNSDDGVRVWIDGVQRINNWTMHSPTLDTTPTITLSAGQRVSVRIEYQERTGGALIQFRWRLPGASTFTTVPANRLYQP
jgi:cytochrome c553